MAATALSAADINTIAAMLEELSAASSLDALRQTTVDTLPVVVESALTAWNELDGRGRITHAVTSPTLNLDDDRHLLLADAFAAHVDDHPVISYNRRTGDGRPYAVSDFLSERAFHATALYQRFYRALNAEDQLSFTLPDAAVTVGIALNRAQRGFSGRDRTICNLLRPYLIGAYRNIEAATTVRDLLAVLDTVAGEHGQQLVLVDRHANIAHQSRGAAATLDRFFDWPESHRLPDQLAAWVNQAPPGPLPGPLIRQAQNRRLIVRQVPVAPHQALLLTEHSRQCDSTQLRRLGLTARQGEVLELITQGLPTKRIAQQLGISPRTVDSHIAQILDRLGVDNRTAAATIASQTPGTTAPPGRPTAAR